MMALMILAAIADGVTFVLLPRGSEANPLIVAMLASGPWIALLSKLALTASLVAARDYLRRYREPVYGFAAAAWGFGAISNVATIWR